MSSSRQQVEQNGEDEMMYAGGAIFQETVGGPVKPVIELYDVLAGVRKEVRQLPAGAEA